MKKGIGIFLLVVFSGFVVWFLRENFDVVYKIKDLSLPVIAGAFVLSMGGIFINGLALEVLAHPFGVRGIRYFWLSSAVSFLNLVTPFRGGAALRAWYLKRVHKLSYADFAAGFFGNYILIFLTASIIGLLLFGTVFWRPTLQNIAVVAIFGIICCGCILMMLRHDLRLHGQNRFSQHWNKVAEGWNILVRDKPALYQMLAIILVGNFLQAATLSLLFAGVGYPISLLQALAISVFSVLGIFFSITPGALGVAESFTMLSALLLGVPVEISLIVALVRRSIDTIVLFILGPIGKLLLLKDLKQ